jgi:hypothetical protein
MRNERKRGFWPWPKMATEGPRSWLQYAGIRQVRGKPNWRLQVTPMLNQVREGLHLHMLVMRGMQSRSVQ